MDVFCLWSEAFAQPDFRCAKPEREEELPAAGQTDSLCSRSFFDFPIKKAL
jgi:hypothetical protein